VSFEINRQRLRTIGQNITLLFGSLLFCFFVIEIGYRFLDPFPFFSSSEINDTEHGNLSRYDATLGWTGVTGGRAQFTTLNNSVWLAHNSEGFRDIEHDYLTEKNPAIVFLGDSFTWGYEVEFEEMFVNRLRNMLSGYEVFNLAHRGYGTDQQLLTFMRWENKLTPSLVILMFCENDVLDNSSKRRYDKPKPKFQVLDYQLVLTGLPVPKDDAWANSRKWKAAPHTWKQTLKKYSHFLHDIDFSKGSVSRSVKARSKTRASIER